MNPKSPFPPSSHLVAYLRDSGGDDQDLSVAQQEEVIRAWCAENAYTLDQVFTDNRTGTTTIGRVGFENMMSFFRQRRRPNVAGLVIWRYSRFSRDLDDAQYYKADLRRRGFKIYSMRDIIPDGIDGRFFETAYDWKSAKDIEILSDEVKRGQKHILRNYGALGGVPPRGFKREEMTIGVRRDGRPHIVARWVPDPDLWETCRLAWRMRASGASYKEINQVTHLFDSLNSYTTFFKNRIYIGEMEFSGEVIQNYTTPLVDLATWNAVQAMNRTRANNTGPENPLNAARSGSSYILSGLALCALCGAPLNGNTIQFKTDNETRKYYHCSRAGRAPHLCQARNIPKTALENVVLESVIEHILSPANLAAVQSELLADYQDQSDDTLARRNELTQQIGNIRRSLSNLTNAIAEAGHTRSILDKISELETQEIQLTDQLSQIDAWLKTPPDQLTPGQLTRYADAVRTIIFTGDQNTQREILRAFIDHITADRNGRQITGVIYYFQPPSDLITNLSDPDPPEYVHAPTPSGGTIYLSRRTVSYWFPWSSFPPALPPRLPGHPASLPGLHAPRSLTQTAPRKIFLLRNQRSLDGLPYEGVWGLLPRQSGGFTQIVVWWHAGYHPDVEPEPALTVTGRRVGGQAGPLQSDRATNASAADIGKAMMVGVVFPTTGCWQITGRYKGAELTFIIWVNE